jgi:hypothetical protein
MFTFLTPSMLPKLTRLHEAAEEQSVVYCLVTNHLEKIDDAAIREGRFDQRIGIYHPDLLSRAGSLRRVRLQRRSGQGEFDEQADERWLRDSLVASAGLSVQRFSKRWLRKSDPSSEATVPDRAELLKWKRDPYAARLLKWEIDLQQADVAKLSSVLKSAPENGPSEDHVAWFRNLPGSGQEHA